MKKRVNSVLRVVSYIIIILVIVGIFGSIAFFTNGLTSDFKTFYLVIEDDYVLTTAGGYVVSASNPLTVNVKYTFGAFSAEQSGFSLIVVPSDDESTNFDFTVDDAVLSFHAERDLTAGFNIIYEESSFTISSKGNIEDILSVLYPDNNVSVDKDSIDFDKDLFKIIVTSYDGQSNVSVTFAIKNYNNASSISLDNKEIVF